MLLHPAAISKGVHLRVPAWESPVFASRQTQRKNFPAPATTVLRCAESGFRPSSLPFRRAIESTLAIALARRANRRRALQFRVRSDPRAHADFSRFRLWQGALPRAVF